MAARPTAINPTDLIPILGSNWVKRERLPLLQIGNQTFDRLELAALMGAGILPVAPHLLQSANGERSAPQGVCLGTQQLFGLTMTPQVGEQ